MGAFDGTAIQPILKTLYSNKIIEDMTYRDYPLYAMMPKSMEFYGEDLKCPIKHGRPQGRSSDFLRAQANKSNSKYQSFLIERVKDYSMVNIDHEQAEASEKDVGAFVKWLKSEMDGCFETMNQAMAWSVYGNSSGTIATIGSFTADTITLALVDDIVKFEVNQIIEMHTLEALGVQSQITATATDLLARVIAVDREAGVITLENASSITPIDLTAGTIAAANFIFTNGDRGARMSGLDSWMPSTTANLATPYFGVNRSVDPTRLAGIRVDGTGLPIEEALTKGVTTGGREGAFPDYYFVNWKKYQDLQNALGAKVQYVKANAFQRADIGFTGIQISSGKKPVTVIPDPFCPDKVAYGLKMDTWNLHSLKAPIRILNLDGNNLLRNSDSDSSELRVGGYFQMACNAPGKNIRLALD